MAKITTQLPGTIITGSVITKTSELINDGDTATSTYVEFTDIGLVAESNDYNDLTNLPNIPTNLDSLTDVTINSALNNDFLQFDSITSLWKNIQLTGALILSKLGFTPENISNKQNSLLVDGTGLKYPTVDAVNTALSSLSIPDASETVAGKVSVGTQTFGGNKTIVGESATVGNAFEVQNLSHTVVAEISNLGDSYFNGVRIGKGNGAGAQNTVLGKTALNNNTTGVNVTAIGFTVLASNTTGSHNTAVGSSALSKNTTGGKNTAIGVVPLFNNTIGASNTAIGYYSMYSNISGSFNLSLGDSSLYSNTTGFENTAIGYFAMYSNTTGNENIGIGSSALHSNTTGSKNIGIGDKSGRYIADGTTNNLISNNSIYIGSNTKALANNQTNQIVIGNDATGAGSNTATIGNTSIVKTVLRGVIAHSTSYTVATLPTGALGDTAFVTDAVAPTYLRLLTGGGSVACPVFHNGTNWVSH